MIGNYCGHSETKRMSDEGGQERSLIRLSFRYQELRALYRAIDVEADDTSKIVIVVTEATPLFKHIRFSKGAPRCHKLRQTSPGRSILCL